MEFVDLKTQQKKIFEKIDGQIKTVLHHGNFIMGPEVQELEKRLAAYIGVKYGIGCSSGTDALLLSLMACSIGPGDAVFTTPFTFIATAEVITLLGAVPIFVDIDPRTFNMDPQSLENAIDRVINLKATPKNNFFDSSLTPRAIIAVDLFGLPADYQQLGLVAKKYGLTIIEDGAQSFGGELDGIKACALGQIGCTSFFPAKPLGCYGDGGMCFTENEPLAESIRSLRIHGKGKDKYDNIRIGVNGRLDTLQAAILLAKFEIFDEEMEVRQQIADRYTRLFKDIEIQRPQIPTGYKSAWAQYSILFSSYSKRQECQKRLASAGVPSAVYYPKPLHLQTAFNFLGYREGDFPVSESISKRILSLPMHPYLSIADQDKVVRLVSMENHF